FSYLGATAQTKLLLLGPIYFRTEEMMDRARSLQIEHVSPAGLMRSEISRRSRLPATAETVLASMRRWFFARKPDAGFVLTDFPATLLQAKVFDEWLEARDESLSGVLAGADAPAPVLEHYRTLGLLIEGPEPIPA
ncbi:MAG: adenylate kinase, partial [Tepidisphaerales bacterium]